MERERRRSTPLPISAGDRNSIASDIDFRTATEAMQRAADAMVAATESFRKQLRQQDSQQDSQQDTTSSPESSPTRRRIDRSTSYSESSSSGPNVGRGRTDRDRDTSRPPRSSSTRRRPASFQPYRSSAEGAIHTSSAQPPPLPQFFNQDHNQNQNLVQNQNQNQNQPRRPATAVGSVRTSAAHATGNGPASQYYMHRTTPRSSTGTLAPPVSLRNPSNMAHSHLLQVQPEQKQTQSQTSLPKLPISEFYTSRPVTADATTGRHTMSGRAEQQRFSDNFNFRTLQIESERARTEKERLAEKDRLEKETAARDDADIAMVMSVSNPRLLQPHETLGPLAMHPVQLPLQPSQPQPQPQPQPQKSESEKSEKPEKPASSSLTPARSVSGRTPPHGSWSLMPKISKSPDAARDVKSTNKEYQYRDIKDKGSNSNPFATVPVGTGARPSAAAGRRPSMSSYIDLIEAASRLKRTPSEQGGDRDDVDHVDNIDNADHVDQTGHATDDDALAGQMVPRYADIDDDGMLHHHLAEPEPVLQIGRYTYVRSDDATNDLEYRASFLRNMQTMQAMQNIQMQNMQMQDAPRYGTYTYPGSLAAPTYRQTMAPPPPPPTQPPHKHKQKHRPKRPPKKSNGPHGFSLGHEILFVLVVCLAQVLMLAGIAQALVPAKIMGRSFPDTNPGSLAWYTASYGLTSGTFVLPAGRLGDLFGHRKIFILGFLWFAVWSLLAGFAPMIQRSGSGGAGSSLHRGTVFFIVARTLQGIGPAMLVPNGQAMLGRAYAPGPRKNMVMSLLGASAPLGFVIGAAMSSLFAVYASWPWAFWTMAAVCVALAAVSILVLPADSIKRRHAPPPPTTMTDELDLADYVDDDEYDDDDVVVSKKKLQRAKALAAKREAAAAAAALANRETMESMESMDSLWVRMDGTGIILGVAGLVLVNFAFNQAPIVGWRTPYTYFLLIIGLLALAAFLHVEARQAKYPLVPLSAMRSTTNFVLGCTATGWGCFSVWIYYAVQVFENLRGWSPLHTSAAFAPAPVTGLMASLLTGFLFSRGVKPHWVMLISMFSFFIGSLLFATSSPAQSQLYWYNAFFSILIMPFGMDMSNPAATILLSNSVSREHQGIAASLVVTFVNYAISLALGVAGSVEAAAYNPDDLLAGYRAAQYFGLGLGGLGILFGTAFLCQSYLRTPPPADTKKV